MDLWTSRHSIIFIRISLVFLIYFRFPRLYFTKRKVYKHINPKFTKHKYFGRITNKLPTITCWEVKFCLKNESLSEWNQHDIFIVTSLSENSKLREWELFFRWILGELNLSLLKKSNNPCPINSFKMKLYLWDSQQHSAVVLTSS